MKTMDALVLRLTSHRPRRLLGRQWLTRCGVVLLLADHDRDGRKVPPCVLMMRRAERAGDPWSGDMSFPGGRVAPADASTRAAALRELREETGFHAASVRTSAQPIGRLSDLLTKEHGRMRPMVISPYVYRTRRMMVLRPGPEAAQLLWVPLAHFANPGRRTSKSWRVAGLLVRAPAIDIDGALVWGLSLKMMDELLHVAGA